MSILKMLFRADGRIRRRDYWLWSVVVIIVYYIIVVSASQVLGPDELLPGRSACCVEFSVDLAFFDGLCPDDRGVTMDAILPPCQALA